VSQAQRAAGVASFPRTPGTARVRAPIPKQPSLQGTAAARSMVAPARPCCHQPAVQPRGPPLSQLFPGLDRAAAASIRLQMLCCYCRHDTILSLVSLKSERHGLAAVHFQPKLPLQHSGRNESLPAFLCASIYHAAHLQHSDADAQATKLGVSTLLTYVPPALGASLTPGGRAGAVHAGAGDGALDQARRAHRGSAARGQAAAGSHGGGDRLIATAVTQTC
jgi:hypothetical protein